MQRLLLKNLLSWKEKQKRKPVLLDGARQTGKTYLLQHLFGKYFEKVVRLDFLESPQLADIFEDSLSPKDVVDRISLALGEEVSLNDTLIIFDEIGECQRAIDSLKFFAEQEPHAFVCASGSNIGLLSSFPVGKVEHLNLRPLTFEEFLLASQNKPLIKAFQNKDMGKLAQEKLFELLKEYYFVGGMPEAVACWFNGGELLARIEGVKAIHNDLILGYERDFGKYSGKLSSGHILQVFHNVPKQLSSNLDGSVNRYRFKDVIEKKKRYQELASPITWLEQCKLISKCHPIDSEPVTPLSTLAKENMFKLFMFDVGLLGAMLKIEYQEQIDQDFIFKGYIAENFVQNELIAIHGAPTYSWETKTNEIEFVIKDLKGNVYPVEVKSGKRTKAKSLKSYQDKYNPIRTVKLIGGQGSIDDPKALVIPLYYASKLFAEEFFREESRA